MSCEEEQDFDDTAYENRNICELYRKCGSAESFLHRTERVYARAVVMKDVEIHTFLDFPCDIDGCVVEIADLSRVEIPVRHLTFFPRGKADIAPLKPLLKKHVDLTVYTNDERSNFLNSVGFQLFYEYGWECWIGLIPKHKRGSFKIPEDVIRQTSVQTFRVLKSMVQKKLLACLLNGSVLKSLAKNDFNDIGKVTVLPDDQRIVFKCVQEVLNTYDCGDDFELVCFCFRFGEKLSSALSLKTFGTENIVRATVHCAVNITSEYGIDLLWSVEGLQQVVGTRGSMSTCLSFSDCANFQSNLDGRNTDISPELRRICSHPDKVLFVQLYGDVPHRRPNTRYHPVAGSILSGLCIGRESSEAFSRDAARYISGLECNLIGTVKGICRLEFVCELPSIPCVVNAYDYINIDQLITLLTKKPMLVPFSRESFSCVRDIGLWATKELREMHKKFQNTGNVEATWRAYQFELALEKLIWGRPLCFRSQNYSVNLGPGELNPSRSATDNLGFLALDPFTTCMNADDSIPNAAIWTQSEIVRKMIRRSAGLHDHINGSYTVIGRRLIYALLADLYEMAKLGVYCRFNEFFATLKSDQANTSTVGVIQLSQLVKTLCGERRMGTHVVYGPLCKLIVGCGINLCTVVEEGLKELGLRKFPAIETYDVHRNPVLKWSRDRKYWLITCTKSKLEFESPVQLSAFVKTELEQRGLIYPSKLKKAPTCMPWISICVRKLAREKLAAQELILTLCFISCVAFIMQGWYVKYESLELLVKDLPIKQHRLKDLEILSKLLVSGFHKMNVYRLHWSIPHRIPEVETAAVSEMHKTDERAKETEMNDDDMKMVVISNRITEDEETEERHVVRPRQTSCASTTFSRMPRWSGAELELLHELSKKTNGKAQMYDLYTDYKRECMERCIAFRTFIAFKRRIQRL